MKAARRWRRRVQARWDWAVLGLLASGRRRYGAELFIILGRADRIYVTLARLEREGLVTRWVDESGRTAYALSVDGRTMLGFEPEPRLLGPTVSDNPPDLTPKYPYALQESDWLIGPDGLRVVTAEDAARMRELP